MRKAFIVTVPKSAVLMKEAGKQYDPVTYEGAGEDPANTVEANKKARDEAWVRWKSILKKV